MFYLNTVSYDIFQGRILVLDLSAGVDPVYQGLDNFFGQPFVFCLLNNYGGANGLYGHVQGMLQVRLGYS